MPVRAMVAANAGEQKVARSATTENRQTAPVSGAAFQHTPAARTGQAVPAGGKGGQTGAGNEPVEKPPGPQIINTVPKAKEQHVPAALAPASNTRSGAVVEKTKEASAGPQAVNAQATAEARTPSKVEKDPQVLPRDGQQGVASKDSPAPSKERARIESVASDGKDVPAAAPKEGGNVALNSAVLAAGESAAATQRPAVSMQVQPQVGGDAAAVRAPVQSVGEQILDSVQASATRGDRQILIRLNPPELGSVLVRFQERGEVLSGTLEVSSRETLREIERALPQVVRSLQEAGVQVRRLDVVPSEQPERDPSREHLSQDAWRTIRDRARAASIPMHHPRCVGRRGWIALPRFVKTLPPTRLEPPRRRAASTCCSKMCRPIPNLPLLGEDG